MSQVSDEEESGRRADPNEFAEVDQRSAGERDDEVKPGRRKRQWVGLAVGLLLAVLVYAVMPADVDHAARLTAATAVLMGIWWMTEAIPIPATALLPLLIFPVLVDDVDINDVGASYGNNIIFLFMGGFLLALAMQRWNLHRRIALLTVNAMGTKPTMVIAGFMIATGFLSMWVSNTATAVMMIPIGVSVLVLVLDIGKKAGAVPDADADADADANANAAALGSALHRALEWITRPGAPIAPGGHDGAIRAAARSFGLGPAQLDVVRRAVQAVLGSAELARFFDASLHLEAGNEVTLAHEGELLRIDRLVALPGEGARRTWWVLDFKLGHTPESSPDFAAAYRQQMARYRAAVQACQPGDEVRSAFITGTGRFVPISG